jgi:hypothetical protein
LALVFLFIALVESRGGGGYWAGKQQTNHTMFRNSIVSELKSKPFIATSAPSPKARLALAQAFCRITVVDTSANASRPNKWIILGWI